MTFDSFSRAKQIGDFFSGVTESQQRSIEILLFVKRKIFTQHILIDRMMDLCNHLYIVGQPDKIKIIFLILPVNLKPFIGGGIIDAKRTVMLNHALITKELSAFSKEFLHQRNAICRISHLR